MSLNHSSVSVMLPVSDPDRAQKFYSEQLRLDYQGTNDQGELSYQLSGGVQLILLTRPDQKPLASTAMSFEVPDLDATIADLEGRGVAFEDYDLPGLKTENHVATQGPLRAAWFLDPDGNVLCVHHTD